ncbi:MAG: GNAT family N-acetyltransferase [Rhodobacteraceae bacterium]|nr:GNAT family N-acetyltransferase [Paracoccaceae bacterium]
MMAAGGNDIEIRLATTDDDRLGVYRLRYRVFQGEFGSTGAGVDHDRKTESDIFDSHAEHLIIVDRELSRGSRDHIVGTCRLLTSKSATASGPGYYSATEFDLGPLLKQNACLLEVGRTCLLPAYRNGATLYTLWTGLADYVLNHGIQILFGVASYHGTDPEPFRQSLSYLHHHHLAPPRLRVTSRDCRDWQSILLPPGSIDRRAALASTPPLIKTYLRLGGSIGHGAFIDTEFRTVDVCILLDTRQMHQSRRAAFESKSGAGS